MRTGEKVDMNGSFFRVRELLDGSIPLIDAHVHTSLRDGCSTSEEHALKARELGLSAVAFTEHVDDHSHCCEGYVGSRENTRIG
jgi:hypothetical protein